MTAASWIPLGVVVAVLVWAVVLTLVRVHRLDRLHVRTDAARAGLAAALDRRAGAALAAAPPGPDPLGVAAAAAIAGRGEREATENALGRALAALDRSRLSAALRDELLEAEQLVVLARRVHNDAVRDTLGLRSRRLVRWLHLAGTAPLPEYFEIVDPAPAGTAVPTSRGPGPSPTDGRRPAALT